MALAQTALKSPLAALFSGTGGYPADASAAATAWANAYAGYAAAATAVLTVPVPADVTTAAGALAGKLGVAFVHALAAGPPYFTTLVTDMVSAFSAFWPPVKFVSPPGAPPAVGVAVGPLPAALTAALTGFFTAGNPPSGPRPSGDSQATSLASVLDTWTRTVLVTNTPATGTPSIAPLT
jgi:hypothetical protein